MPSSSLAVVQTVPILKGTPEFESARDSVLEEFAAKVPQDLRLDSSITSNPPKNVTGVPRECGILTKDELEITENYDAVGLAEAIATKKFSAVAVATAFSKRAIIAHQLTCCLTEWFMDEAIERAKSLDEYLEKTGKTVGPFHGVPISVKEHMALTGHYTMMGYFDTRTKHDYDTQLVATLRAAGAVFFCKTTQPQSIMHLESVSIWGRVLNPYNIGLTSGGSTGGEAALIAMRGSPLGLGTDIGGSVRDPAGVCGIFGFKPSSYMLPMKGQLIGGFPAELTVLGTTGPMCTSLRTVDLFMSVVLAAKPYLEDPRLIPIPWTGLKGTSQLVKAGPLKIGFMMHDGDIMPQPPVTRALEWARSQLEKSSGGGVQVKPFAPFGAAQAMHNIRLAYWPDGANATKQHLANSGEPMFPLTKWIIKDAEGPEKKASEIVQMRVNRDQFRCDFAAHWEQQDVDFVICPVFVGPACAHETAFYWNYTAFWNYVDYPGVVFPTPISALKKGEEDYAPANSAPLSERCKHVRQLWADGDFENAPIDLQIVARKYHDNDLVAALGAIRESLGL